MPKRERRFYPTQDATNLTDAPWTTSAPCVTITSPKGRRPTDIDWRAIVNALRSKQRTGCRWRLLPADVPPMSSVRFSFDRWNRDGTFVKMSDTLRQLVRQAPDRDPAPAEWLLAAHHDCFPRLKDMRVDEGDASSLDPWLQQHTTMRVNVIEQPVGHKGFAVIPKRWGVEHSIAWAGRNRLANK